MTEPVDGTPGAGKELDYCLRAAGIDPDGPRPTGTAACALPAAPVSPTPSLVPLTTAPATLPTAPATR